jgi:hypothetical protein
VGENCQDQVTPLVSKAASLTGQVSASEWQYYQLSANATSYTAIVEETNGQGGLIWAFAGLDNPPTEEDYILKDTNRGSVHVLHYVADSQAQRDVVIGVMGSGFGAQTKTYKISGFAF